MNRILVILVLDVEVFQVLEFNEDSRLMSELMAQDAFMKICEEYIDMGCYTAEDREKIRQRGHEKWDHVNSVTIWY